jgi:hypothetical protein
MGSAMAQAKPCPKCDEPHFNFQKCRVRENQKEGLSYWKTRANLPEGQKVWGQEILDEYELRGKLIVQKSGMQLRPHLGSIRESGEA